MIHTYLNEAEDYKKTSWSSGRQLANDKRHLSILRECNGWLQFQFHKISLLQKCQHFKVENTNESNLKTAVAHIPAESSNSRAFENFTPSTEP